MFLACVFFNGAGLTFAHTLHVVQDTHTNTKKLHQKNGKDGNIQIKTRGGENERHGYFQFNLDTLPAGTGGQDIDKATLRIFVHDVHAPGDIAVHRVMDEWDEETLNQGLVENGAVNLNPVPETITSISNEDRENVVTFDVTQLVKDWLDGVFPNHGVALLPSAGGIGNIKVKVTAKEKSCIPCLPKSK